VSGENADDDDQLLQCVISALFCPAKFCTLHNRHYHPTLGLTRKYCDFIAVFCNSYSSTTIIHCPFSSIEGLLVQSAMSLANKLSITDVDLKDKRVLIRVSLLPALPNALVVLR
jgi:hypothetical protein